MPDTLPGLLAASVLLGLLHVLLAATLSSADRGLKWSIGNRDGGLPPASAPTDRAQRASRNFLETFPFFAAAVLCAIATGREGHQAQLGAQIWLWARVAYLPLYLLGTPLVRSVAWGVSLAGLLIVVLALF